MATTNINMTKNPVTLATEGTYCDKDIKITAALQEKTITPTTAAQDITPDTGNVGLSKVVVSAVPTQIKNITLTTVASTDILPDAGKFLSKVMVSPRLQNKTFYPAEQTEGGIVSVDEGYAGLESVEIAGIELEEKTATENGEVVPYAGRFLSKVIVNVPAVVDVATAAEMNAKLVAANVGKVYRFTGTTDSTYTNGDLYEVTNVVVISFTISDTVCNADEGMTFYAWANSDYPARSGLNVSCESLNGTVKTLDPTRYLYPSDSNTMIQGSDIITSNGSYRWIAG